MWTITNHKNHGKPLNKGGIVFLKFLDQQTVTLGLASCSEENEATT